MNGLKAYEAERRPIANKIVALNRKGGPEVMIDMVEERAPNGFKELSDVATPEELEAIFAGYTELARGADW